MNNDGLIQSSDLPKRIRENIKEKEKELDRKCGKMWTFTNPYGNKFVFAYFNKGRSDRIVVTVAEYISGIGYIWPHHHYC